MAIKDTQENYGAGWISVYRSIVNSWLWEKPLSKFEAWLDILLQANYKSKKVNIKNQLFVCKRGESIKCMETWAERWGWNRSRVRRFLKLLESDSMIVLKATNKTTKIIVCNYESYQDMRPTDDQQMTIRRPTDDQQMTTNNKGNKDNNINKKKGRKKITRFSPPSPQEVTEYANSISYKLSGDAFVDFYKSKGWLVGKNKMKDWQAAVRTWKQKDGNNGHKPRGSIDYDKYRSELATIEGYPGYKAKN